LERRGKLLRQSDRAEGRSQRQGGVGVLQFRRAGETAGGVRDAIALWAGQSAGARADERGAAAADAGLAGQRTSLVPARCRLDRSALGGDPRALDAMAYDMSALSRHARA